MDNSVPKKKIDVSIVIPARNEEQHIGKCLESIVSQDSSYCVEVTVIDSGSTDQTVHIVKQYPSVKLVEIKPEAFSHGKTRNYGVEISSGDYIVFLNADATPANPLWLDPLIRHLEKDNQIAGVYSRHIPRSDCHLYMVRDLQQSMPSTGVEKTDVKNLDFMIFSTVSAAIRRKVWHTIPFDPEIVIAEDQDWAKRVLKSGYKIVYVPESMVFHSHNYSMGELFRLKAQVGQSFKIFNHKVSALFFGFFLILGGMMYKTAGDFCFIFKQKLPFTRKIKEIIISKRSRLVSFIGRYTGWLRN